jgi:hypothetical protein
VSTGSCSTAGGASGAFSNFLLGVDLLGELFFLPAFLLAGFFKTFLEVLSLEIFFAVFFLAIFFLFLFLVFLVSAFFFDDFFAITTTPLELSRAKRPKIFLNNISRQDAKPQKNQFKPSPHDLALFEFERVVPL